MKTFLFIILATISLQASNLYLVLTPAQFNVANNRINAQNGWPDGKGTFTYAQPFQFSEFTNCPVPLQDRVGLMLDKALIRHCRLEGETKQDAIVRVVTIIRNNLPDPRVAKVVPTGDEENPTATFDDVTDTVADKLRELVNQ